MFANADMHNANQAEDDEASDIASKNWDAALEAYEKRLVDLQFIMPPAVWQFMTRMNLHDAFSLSSGFSPNGDKYMLTVRQTDSQSDRYLAILIYDLVDVEGQKHTGPGFHSPHNQTYWLYDEFDMVKEGVFLHEVLFSDGTQLNISFKDFHFIQAPMAEGYIEV